MTISDTHRRQAANFEDAIGALMDAYLQAGLPVEAVQHALRYQADYAPERKTELAA